MADNMASNESIDKYGSLLANLEEYFPTEEEPVDRSAEFIFEYREHGEDDPRFFGVLEQIELGIKHPQEFSRVIENQLGWEFTPTEIRKHLIQLRDDLIREDPEELQRREAAEDVTAMFDYWSKQTLRLPISVPRFGSEIPIYAVASIGAVLGGIGWLGYTYLKLPVIEWVFFVMTAIGCLALFYGALVMFLLRQEIKDEKRKIEREQELKEFGENARRGNGILGFFRRK